MAEAQITPEAMNEQVLLGSLMVNENLRDMFASDVKPDDFIYSNHKCFAYAINYIHTKKMTMTADTVFELASKYNNNTEIQYDYILRLMKMGTAQNINEQSCKYYIERVKCRTMALTIKAEHGTKLLQALDSSDSTYENIVRSVEDIREKIMNTQINSDGYQSLTYHQERWRKKFEERKRGYALYPTGYSHLDYFLTQGFSMGTVSVVAGRPGSGKSSLVDNIVDRISTMSSTAAMGNLRGGTPVSPFLLSKPVPCALCALEMDGVSTMDRLLSIRTRIPLTDIIRNPAYLNKEELQMIDTFAVDYAENPYIYIDDKPRQTVDILFQRVARLKKKLKAEEIIVFVDLFGTLDDMNEDIQTTTAAAYENALRKVQIGARDLNAHFCLVSQIGRKAEGARTSKKKVINNRPTLSHLKHSGAWEEVADLILLVYRQKYYQPELPVDICEVNIAKQRQGIAGKIVNLFFDGRTTTLYTTTERLVEQTSLNLNIINENDFAEEDKHLYYSELGIEEREQEKDG